MHFCIILVHAIVNIFRLSSLVSYVFSTMISRIDISETHGSDIMSDVWEGAFCFS